MSDIRAGKYQSFGYIRQLFRHAGKILEGLGTLEWGTHDYQAFTFKSDKVSLVFYPHKVKTTGNHHLRVRDQGSKDKKQAYTYMQALSESTPDCHFSFNWPTADRNVPGCRPWGNA